MSEEFNLTTVPQEYLHSDWDSVSPLLDSAIQQGGNRWNVHSVREDIHRGKQQLWIAYDENDKILVAFTTSVDVYPNRTIMSYMFLGGSELLKNADKVDKVVCEFALLSGCDGIDIVGRVGFRNVAGELGYKSTGTWFYKDLKRNTNGQE